MTRVKIKNPGKIGSDIKKKFSSFTKDQGEMDRAAKIMRTELVANLRSGIGSDDELLPDLKIKTIKRRGELSRYNKTASKYLQFFSNVTFSGQFVRSLKVTSRGSFFDFIYTGIHKGYKNRNGTRQDDVKNSLIFKGLSERGWKLAGVTTSARERIRKQFIRFLRRK